MHTDISLIIFVALTILMSPYLARVLNIPTTPIEIIAGSILGYFGVIHPTHVFDLLAEFGFLYLMFLAGSEIDLRKVLRTPLSQLKMIILYLFLLYFMAFIIVTYLQLSNIFYIILPLISIGLVAALAKEYGKTMDWIVLSLTAGTIGEVVSIGALTFSSAVLNFGVSIDLLTTMIALFVFLFCIVILFRLLQLLFWWFPEVSVVLMPHEDNKEQDIRISMGILFLFLAIMLYLNLELAFGAFIAGIFIPTFFAHKQALPHKLESYGFGFFIPIFFIHIGTSFHLDALLIPGLVAKALQITLITIVIRLLASVVFYKTLKGVSLLLFALSHAMPLTLLIAVATIAYYANSIDKFHYFAFILASLIEVLVVMITIRLVSLFRHQEPEPPYNEQEKQALSNANAG